MMDDACLLHHVRGHREEEGWDGRSGRPIRRSPLPVRKENESQAGSAISRVRYIPETAGWVRHQLDFYFFICCA